MPLNLYKFSVELELFMNTTVELRARDMIHYSSFKTREMTDLWTEGIAGKTLQTIIYIKLFHSLNSIYVARVLDMLIALFIFYEKNT